MPLYKLQLYRYIERQQSAASMSRKGNCWDNAAQESFSGYMKDEIDISGCQTFGEVKAVIDDGMDYYNNGRYQ